MSESACWSFPSSAPPPRPPSRPGGGRSSGRTSSTGTRSTGRSGTSTSATGRPPARGNDELEYYTSDPRNAFVRDGSLHIVARKEASHGKPYTSARIKSKARDGSRLFAQAYGRFEFRAKLPTGRGVWPALWMLPQDTSTYGGWPCSGEIDVMEARGQEPDKVLGTIHFGAPWPGNVHSGGEYHFPAGQSIDQFHEYAVEWEPGVIRWLVDGHLFATKRSWWTSRNKGKPASEADVAQWPAPFDKPFHIIMNVAVGGKFLGNPDASTTFPAEMVVDHVRVYEKTTGYGDAGTRGPENLPWKK
ncbi:glycoside hydrolase family 16 protein [Paludisphaera rhizosphaerae]|uniref:glycoside hydrolase family 16 protein n=1 Tax=Paludisphaera rhizosphaerae TaxID=2711216 RepID=UPI00197DE05E|nr:glycoside hydrolase family 16 protein [Paludisphaera rhizosphaerae]